MENDNWTHEELDALQEMCDAQERVHNILLAAVLVVAIIVGTLPLIV